MTRRAPDPEGLRGCAGNAGGLRARPARGPGGDSDGQGVSVLETDREPRHHRGNKWEANCSNGSRSGPWREGGLPGTWGSSKPVGTFHWSTCSFRAFTSSMSPGTLRSTRWVSRRWNLSYPSSGPSPFAWLLFHQRERWLGAPALCMLTAVPLLSASHPHANAIIAKATEDQTHRPQFPQLSSWDLCRSFPTGLGLSSLFRGERHLPAVPSFQAPVLGPACGGCPSALWAGPWWPFLHRHCLWLALLPKFRLAAVQGDDSDLPPKDRALPCLSRLHNGLPFAPVCLPHADDGFLWGGLSGYSQAGAWVSWPQNPRAEARR